jgi:hypothetical protein
MEMKLLQVKEANKQGHEKYTAHVKNGGYPNCLAIYLWIDENGNTRKNGWVVEHESFDSQKYFKNKAEALDYIKSITNFRGY